MREALDGLFSLHSLNIYKLPYVYDGVAAQNRVYMGLRIEFYCSSCLDRLSLS